MTDDKEENVAMPVENTSDGESGSGNGSGSGSESEEETVELLINTREKRSTAGNRLASLLQQEDPDDELELLFAEADDDAGFEDVEADSDVQMDSSDDDEDEGPAAGADDLEGEKELQKKERAEKLKKRKANDGLPKAFRKKIKIDPTATSSTLHAPATRPKKKSERASWLPTPEDAPTRMSARKATRQSKEQLHAQMVDREIKRVKQLENMERAAARKKAAEKPPMTQADRLAEAGRVERRNAKSLSRWEESEQQREEEQAVKLAALSNRHLSGPVITWWSGKAEWVGGNLRKVGKVLELEDPVERKNRKRKAAELEAESTAKARISAAATPIDGDVVMMDTPTVTDTPSILPSPAEDKSPTAGSTPTTETPAPIPPDLKSIQALDLKATSILAHPIQPPPPLTSFSQPSPVANRTTSLAPPASYSQPQHQISIPTPRAAPQIKPTHPPFILAPPQAWPGQPQYKPPPPPPNMRFDGSSPLPPFGPGPALLPRLMSSQHHLNQQAPPQLLPLPIPAGPPSIEHATRNCLILSNFDEDSIKDHNVQMQIVFGRKFIKAAKKKRDHELCVITSFPAKFRDPATGLPYCNAFAYREIQKLKRGEYKWSKLVGAYVGSAGFAARGVPARFANPKAERPVVPPAMAPVPQSVNMDGVVIKNDT
ncbi:YL1 nuclear protein-domain-containing protein [Calycina marina]|uniref:YL1 nuclear protein-domain-containing protein n=1 Tax=Calycina marina TaxID=1763456 RepID=A0A9P8CHU3_9HELO|nr:YL1 nuclear protein-domain-containing protein [Calycina marina]